MKNKKKIIVYFMANTKFRGGVISLYNLLRHLDRSIYEPLYVTCADGDHVNRITSLGIKCYVFKIPTGFLEICRDRLLRDIFMGVPNLLKTLKAIIQIVHFIKKEKVYLIHSHDQKSSILGVVISILSGVPIIWHVRDVPKGLTNLMNQCFGIFAKKIIAISKTVANPFKRNFLLKKKVFVIYNGVDLSVFNSKVDKNEFRSQQKLQNEIIVGQIASLIPVKGIQYFIDAAHCLIGSGFNCMFFVIGDTKMSQYKWYGDELKKKIVGLDLEEYFKFLDFRDDIQEALASFDIFVFTSTRDGFGKAVVEAMALKIPVIAFDIGANKEIIKNGESGILVPPKNYEALAEAIKGLLKNEKLRRSLGECGYRRVVKYFEIKDNVNRIENIYRSI